MFHVGLFRSLIKSSNLDGSRLFSNVISGTSELSSVVNKLESHFINPRIHNLLRMATDRNPIVVHRPEFRVAKSDSIKVLSDYELEIIQRFSSTMTEQRLQMPPVITPWSSVDEKPKVINKDVKLQGLLPSNYRLVFTDISLSKSRRNRFIVVRESNGSLRHASGSERQRINQIYFPLPGRSVRQPLMFSDPHLSNLLDRGRYTYVLDSACAQFEPDDPDYSRVVHAVYNHLITCQSVWLPLTANNDSTENPLKRLRSTKHYGPIVLYLIGHANKSAPLLYEALASQHYTRTASLLWLILLLKPTSSFASAMSTNKPLPELDCTNLQADERLSHQDVESLLECVKIFIREEKLSRDDKQRLEDVVDNCLASLPTQDKEVATVCKNLVFYTSFAYNWLVASCGLRQWYSRVDQHLILGALPLASNQLTTLIKREHVTHVVSMLQPYEVKNFVAGPDECAKLGVGHLSLPVQDFVASPSLEQINLGIQFISEALTNTGPSKSTVYVHCKAGRTRSTVLLVCYLMYRDQITDPQVVVDRLRRVRPHINLGPTHWLDRGMDFDQTTPLHDKKKESDAVLSEPQFDDTGSQGDTNTALTKQHRDDPKPHSSPSSPFTLLLGLALVFRLALLIFSVWQDATRWPDGRLRFTDVDFDVFTDAAKAFVNQSNMYAARPTYRYSPLLAILLAPGHWLLGLVPTNDDSNWIFALVDQHRDLLAGLWGKLLFISADLLCAYLQWAVGNAELSSKTSSSRRDAQRCLLRWIAFGWLFNPLTATISVRGNAEALLGLCVLGSLLAAIRIRAFISGLLFGLAVHLKIYPVIYGPALYLWFAQLNCPKGQAPFSNWRFLLLPNRSHFAFLLASLSSLLSLTVWTFARHGGWLAIQQAYLYHVGRVDIKHNFAPHFYPLYLLTARYWQLNSSGGEATTIAGDGVSTWFDKVSSYLSSLWSASTSSDHQVVSETLFGKLTWLLSTSSAAESNLVWLRLFNSLSLILSLLLVLVLSAKLYRQPALCWFVVTHAFVSFNKVCTSQYFVWSLVLLPTLASSLSPTKRPTNKHLALLTTIWLSSQAIWLTAAYQLEMTNWTLIPPHWSWRLVWLASLLFLSVNVATIRYFVQLRSSSDVDGGGRLKTD